MKFRKNAKISAGLLTLIVVTYFSFTAVNQSQVAHANEKSSAKVSGKVALESHKAKLGYTFGAQIGNDLSQSGMTEKIDIDAFLAAIRDFATGAKPQMTDEEMQATQQVFAVKRQEEYAVLVAQNQAQGEEFLAKNKAEKGVLVTDSGLQYEVVRKGKGKQPTAENTVKVHYLGMLPDGTPFDSSYQRNEPANFPVTQVIPGFSEGLQLMKEGAKYRFTIPASLAYGERGQGAIGPNQVLVFEVELIEVL